MENAAAWLPRDMDMDRTSFTSELREIADNVYGHIGAYLGSDSHLFEKHLREVGGSYLEHRGKCLRPALLTFCCRAAGGLGGTAVPAAAAVEMFHTWTLMHDDVIDHDDLRRGRPTAHVRGRLLGERDLALSGSAASEYGAVLAILGGDYIHGAASDMLLTLECRPAVVLSLARRMSGRLNAELLAGEHLDVRLSHTPWDAISEDDVNLMMRGKTGALLAYCAEAGTAIGEDTPPESSGRARSMADFARLCGLAFQMKDDLLGVFGDEASFGKPVGSDIREGKRTVLMLRTYMRADSAQRRLLDSVLGREGASASGIDDVRNIAEATGSLREVEALSAEYIQKALDVLHGTLEPSADRDFLEQWALSLVDRNK